MVNKYTYEISTKNKKGKSETRKFEDLTIESKFQYILDVLRKAELITGTDTGNEINFVSYSKKRG